jgi:hypothetical protein
VASSPQSVETTRRERSHSGRLLLRMPEALHAKLASAADRAGMSLNQFITTTLAESVGQEQVPARPRASKSDGDAQADEGRGKWFTALLVVNLVVVAAAGILAILLLVSAWGS